ncbi:class I SAM-dependent methyltransferase [Ruegeria sp. HKCCA6837]|uniref:class I SAM-dependent methyltransferase n=1 Tax=Ruegeria sp. HKCCA6837 TaxID=2682989 RepID=UPI001489608B|nr:class I SAM-dependent methyltransferase [Ruegeria sp. HKCCA6837]
MNENVKFLGTRVPFPNYVPPVTAWLEHGPFVMWLVQKMQPQTIVELGTHFGYSFFAMCEATVQAKLNTSCHAIDTWEGDEHAGRYGAEVYNSVSKHNAAYEQFASLHKSTFAEAVATFEDNSIDLLHVDGRHFYEDVKEDFEQWIPKLSTSAVVLFHDTEVRERDFGVYRYWAEVSANRLALNFRHGHGLGVLFWGSEISDNLQDLARFSKQNDLRKVVLDFFECAGAAMRERHHAATQIAAIDERINDLNVANGFLEKKLCGKDSIIEELRLEVSLLREKVLFSQKRPHKLLLNLFEYKILKGLLLSGSLISQRTRKRFSRSADRRDPNVIHFNLR